MPLDNLAFIITVEVAGVLLIVCAILIYLNISQRKLIKKLQARMTELIEELQLARQTPPPPAPPPQRPAKAYLAYVDEQIELSKEHHLTLDSEQDIALDLAPDVALPKRAAALRYAVFLAEKEALMAADGTDDDAAFDWTQIHNKYHQIFDFYDDYSDSPDTNDDAQIIAAMTQELLNAKKRINNLEKFKALYFDLEEQWEESKKDAQTLYSNLSSMADGSYDKQAYAEALKSYQTSYNNIDQIILQGVNDPNAVIDPSKLSDIETTGELRHLKMVTADQHKIITDLQVKLKEASTDEMRGQVIGSLKEELNKQKRFLQESDTCIQVMEEELNNAHIELDQLKSRLKALPSIKTQMLDLRKQKDEYELKVYTLTSENRKMMKKINDDALVTAADPAELAQVKRKLTQLETKHAHLEGKYLDLKMRQ